jgi:hypothetical protein
MIKRQTLIEAASTIVTLAAHYKGAPHREMRIDGLVYGVLHTKFGVRRQHQVRNQARVGGHPDRIDFKQSGTNPVVIEFAVRTATHLNEIYGSQNGDELKKLAKQVRMKARYLLLLDLSGNAAISRGRLEPTYDSVNAGRGRFPRSSVRVIYVHPDSRYHFLWRPWA